MILMAIQQYFLKVKQATLSRLAKEFNLQEDILQDMLAVWVRKGKLKKIMVENDNCSSRCQSCSLGCSSTKNNLSPTIVYEWVV